MTQLLSLVAFSCISSAPPQNQYTANLGTLYLLGPTTTVSGSKEKLELGIQRLVALKSVKTCLAFGIKS